MCLSCRMYVRSHLSRSKYEGCVTLWDMDTGLAAKKYEAHNTQQMCCCESASRCTSF